MKKLLLFLVIASSLISCKKDSPENENYLSGTWRETASRFELFDASGKSVMLDTRPYPTIMKFDKNKMTVTSDYSDDPLVSTYRFHEQGGKSYFSFQNEETVTEETLEVLSRSSTTMVLYGESTDQTSPDLWYSGPKNEKLIAAKAATTLTITKQ